jgi:hypothetical protein
MSLDITSHPGRPGPDELVPSRYALRVGEIGDGKKLGYVKQKALVALQ